MNKEESKEVNEELIQKMPSYRDLFSTIHDLYYLEYSRRSKTYKSFSYGSIKILINNHYPREGTSAFYEDELKDYCSAVKVRKYMQKKNLAVELDDSRLMNYIRT